MRSPRHLIDPIEAELDCPEDLEPFLCDRCRRPVRHGDEWEVEGFFYCPDCAEEVRHEMAASAEAEEVERAKRAIAEDEEEETVVA